MDGRQQDINDREVLGTSWGTKTENHRAGRTMTMTKLADTELKETIAKTITKGIFGGRGEGQDVQG